MTNIANNIITALQEIFPDKQEGQTIAMHEPKFSGNELKYVEQCITSGWVSSAGSFVDKFEEELAKFVGAKHAIATVNGTSALHLCLIGADIAENDEVLMPALTFVATANAISYQKAIPHFVDIAPDTLGVCPAKLDEYLGQIANIDNQKCINRQTGRTIKAIIPMHTFGHTVDMDALNIVAQKYHLTVIEDAAESLGSKYKDQHAGALGQMAALSFNGNKIITTGGGGAIVTNDSDLAQKLKHISTTARIPNGYKLTHDQIAYNYRMPNINAALGCAQIEYLPDIIKRKRTLAQKYNEYFKNINDIDFISEPANCQSNYWLNAIRCHRPEIVEEILQATNSNGFMTRPAWDLMNDLPMYNNCPAMDLSNSKAISATIVNLPSSYFLVR